MPSISRGTHRPRVFRLPRNAGRRFDVRRRCAFGLVAIVVAAVVPGAAPAQTVEQLNQLSIEDLARVEITSVSKRPEQVKSAAASVYVITHEAIMRSGAASIPEILRLAPNLFVAQTSASSYIVTARGFSGNINDQNFTNKLLVLVDGRSVYTPLYAGVYWDAIDVMPEDIERIEVISGPGATLWGANAVNGVINIITRRAKDTQGGLLELGIGNQQSLAGLQYGGTVSDDVAYRLYGKAFYDRSEDTFSGSSAHDAWYKPQGGFRVDWTPQSDQVTFQGDFYEGDEQQIGQPDTVVEGRNLEATWQHDLGSGSSLQILAYYDQSQRDVENDGTGFALSAYDLEIQHNFALGSWNNFVWGAGERLDAYSIIDRLSPVTSLLFEPPDQTLNLADVFAEDHMSLKDSLDAILGLKLEDDPWSGVSPLPTARLSWRANDEASFWAAVSRAIRAPTPFDTDVVEKLGTTPFLIGNPNFLPEELWAYELGYRGELSDRLSFSVSGYFNEYDHLKSIQLAPPGQAIIQWGNTISGNVYGVEAWSTFQMADWWRLDGSLDLQTESLVVSPFIKGLPGPQQEGDDPHHQAALRSSMDITGALTLDADLRYVGTLPDPHVPQYVELNSRLGWKVTDRLELSLSGFNLLHDRHQEFSPTDTIKRSFLIDTRWKF
ncbi:MAG: TonB-dependent receptor [Rhizomicrobium sp.]